MYGGAVCSVGGKVVVKKSKFKSNTVGRFGCAVYARLGTLYASSSEFIKNKADYAGGLCLVCHKSTVKYSKLTGNKAYTMYNTYYKIKNNELVKCTVS